MIFYIILFQRENTYNDQCSNLFYFIFTIKQSINANYGYNIMTKYILNQFRKDFSNFRGFVKWLQYNSTPWHINMQISSHLHPTAIV